MVKVNRGDWPWLWSPANIKGANKDSKIYVGRSTTVHNLLFCAHTLCMSYVTNTFLLVSSSVRSKQLLCFVQGQGQKREQKHTTKNFDEFDNHSSPSTMIEGGFTLVGSIRYNGLMKDSLSNLYIISLLWPVYHQWVWSQIQRLNLSWRSRGLFVFYSTLQVPSHRSGTWSWHSCYVSKQIVSKVC